MNINISAVHFKSDQKLDNFIIEKVTKLSKLYDGILGVEVTLKIDNSDKPENKRVEIRLKIRGNDAISGKVAKTFEEATDNAVEALKRQIRKIKDKERGN